MTGERAAVVGLGAVGGSVALALRDAGWDVRCYALSEADREAAAAAGLVVARTLAEAVAGASVVLVAVPLDVLAAVAADIAATAPGSAALLHAGSLLRDEATGFDAPLAARVIGTHPLAGSAAHGFAAARVDAFRGATVLVDERAGAAERAAADRLWRAVGAGNITYLDAGAHDDWMAWASHLPQLAATAVGATLAESPFAQHAIGRGARDTTRLAGSSLGVWSPILARAPEATIQALEALERNLAELRGALSRRDWAALEEAWTEARNWRLGAEGR